MKSSFFLFTVMASFVLMTGCGREFEGGTEFNRVGAERISESVARVERALDAELQTCKTDSECPPYHVCRSGRCYAQ